MDSFILSPILSSIISILLFSGCYQLGKILVNKLNLNTIVRSISIIEFQYLAFGSVFLLIILFPIVAFTSYAKIILQIFGLILVFLGLFFFYELPQIINKCKKIKKKKQRFILLYIINLHFFIFFTKSITFNFF